jgi:PAS domain S-box-containing protein
MFNPETDQAAVLAVHRADDGKVGLGMRFSTQVFGEDLETLARGQTLVVEDLQRMSPPWPPFHALQADGVRSCVNVPLIAQGELMGTLNLGANTPGAFAPEHLAVAREVADQLAIGIQQARLYKQVRLHASALEQRVEERTAELRASETRFRTLFEQAAVGIALIDAEGRLIETNPALQTMLGYTGEKLRGRVFSELVHCSEEPSEIHLYEDLIAGRRDRYRAEGRCTRKDGELAWVNMTASLVRGGEGEPRFAIFMVEDVTEQKHTQAALLRAEKLAVAGRLVASLTHEINNPLQSVIGFLGLADETLAEGGDVGRYLRVALEELRRVARIVGQLRDLFRRPEQEEREPIDVNELLDRVLTLSQRKCEESGIEVIWNTEVDLTPIPLVRDQIQQVFLNLMLNAVEAMPEGGQLRVEVASTQDPAGVSIAFADDGVGIASDKLRRVFDPFYSTKPEGLGMGLFTSQEIVEQHGGHIEVVSQLGHGATFTVWLRA